MRKLLFFIICLTALSSCRKKCDNETSDTCNERPPTDELCLAAFERWFYNEDDNKCVKISYSGCNQWGFATEEECKECVCIK